MHAFWCVLAGVLALAPLRSLSADLNSAVPPIESKGTWHIITVDGPGTTSQCIGDLSSAWCALETYLACVVREQRALCEQVATLRAEEDARYETTLLDRKLLLYRVLWSQRGAPEGMEEPHWWYWYENYLPPQDPMFQDAIYIELFLKECDDPSGNDCRDALGWDSDSWEWPFLLAPVGDRWRMLRTGSEGSSPFRSLSPEGEFPLYRVKRPPRGGAPTLPR